MQMSFDRCVHSVGTVKTKANNANPHLIYNLYILKLLFQSHFNNHMMSKQSFPSFRVGKQLVFFYNKAVNSP